MNAPAMQNIVFLSEAELEVKWNEAGMDEIIKGFDCKQIKCDPFEEPEISTGQTRKFSWREHKYEKQYLYTDKETKQVKAWILLHKDVVSGEDRRSIRFAEINGKPYKVGL
ncbi:MAG TPA: hypothetical protein VKR82_06530 [Candidatus Acidoferrales bacterium]|nr:hypothetical protein [Candidatus Acidoferrales bacterium]